MAWWAKTSLWILEEQRQHLCLRIRALSSCLPVDLHLHSPPRKAGGASEDEEARVSHRPVQRRRARIGAPSLPPDLHIATRSLSLPSPPWPDREKERGGDNQEEEAAADLEII
jgi:hypothetical protein